MIPAFIAGVLTFLAPCTFPLVPGYLGFISGVSVHGRHSKKELQGIRKKVFLNGLLYVIGFSVVFILFGTLFGAAGVALAKYRLILTRIGGILVIFFGLYLMHIFKLPFFNFLNKQKKLSFASSLTPGKPSSSFLFGASFAFGWTPCVGPVLGSILVLASTSGQIASGAFLLFIFSLGLALPFLLLALGIGHAFEYVKRISKYLDVISIVGGALLVLLGILLVSGNFGVWTSLVYSWFDFINYDAILDYL